MARFECDYSINLGASPEGQWGCTVSYLDEVKTEPWADEEELVAIPVHHGTYEDYPAAAAAAYKAVQADMEKHA